MHYRVWPVNSLYFSLSLAHCHEAGLLTLCSTQRRGVSSTRSFSVTSSGSCWAPGRAPTSTRCHTSLSYSGNRKDQKKHVVPDLGKGAASQHVKLSSFSSISLLQLLVISCLQIWAFGERLFPFTLCTGSSPVTSAHWDLLTRTLRHSSSKSKALH